MHCTAKAIEVTSLSFAYPDGTEALLDVSFTIEHGQRVALLGPNGAGKSTLIEHLNGITEAQSGEIAIEDIVITTATSSDVRSRVGVVFQDPDNMLFMTSIQDDIEFGPLNMGLDSEEVKSRTINALNAVDLLDKAHKPGIHLSFGQKKRAALAAVLSMEPRVLVLDEPTSNLDPASRRSMIELIESLDITLLIATHDMELAWQLCDHALLLDAGRIVAYGPAQDIMVDEALMLSHGLAVPLSATCPQ